LEFIEWTRGLADHRVLPIKQGACQLPSGVVVAVGCLGGGALSQFSLWADKLARHLL